MAKPAKKIDRLPSAPLAEVVFELRWKLISAPNIPAPMASDPGFSPLLDGFTRRARQLGFGSHKEITPPGYVTGAHAVYRRYYTGPEVLFPLLQLGPGIFASNQSTEYVWSSFRKQTLNGLKALLASYPKLESFPLRPSHLELRYIDSFDASLAGTTNFVEFANAASNLKISLPAILDKANFHAGKTVSRFIHQTELKSPKGSSFSLDMGSGTNAAANSDIIRLESKVVSIDAAVPKMTSALQFLAAATKWIDAAHEITSPFFKDLIKPEVMRRFEERR